MVVMVVLVLLLMVLLLLLLLLLVLAGWPTHPITYLAIARVWQAMLAARCPSRG